MPPRRVAGDSGRRVAGYVRQHPDSRSKNHGSMQAFVLAGVTDTFATMTAAKVAMDSRCGSSAMTGFPLDYPWIRDHSEVGVGEKLRAISEVVNERDHFSGGRSCRRRIQRERSRFDKVEPGGVFRPFARVTARQAIGLLHMPAMVKTTRGGVPSLNIVVTLAL